MSFPVDALLPVVGSDLLVPVAGGARVPYANLDYAASSPPLLSVIEAVTAAVPMHSNVSRGSGYPSRTSADSYESARAAIAAFVGARPDDSLVFTRNTTDALNLLASAVPGDVITLDIEHHANLLPWLARGARLLPSGRSIQELLSLLEYELKMRQAALIAVTGASNVTGERLPLRRLAQIAHRYGARLAVDAAQLVPHRRVDMAAEGIDFLAFSGHKFYSPFLSGVLVGRGDWLDSARPHRLGGGAVSTVHADTGATWQLGPARHEAGSPDVLGAVAIAAAIDALKSVKDDAFRRHEATLRARLVDGLTGVPGVTLHRIFDDAVEPVGILSFTVDGIDSDRAANALAAERGIGVRDGRFSAHPLLERFGGPAIRASIGVGTTSTDVERLLAAVIDLAAHPDKPSYDMVDGEWTIAETDPRAA
jgi:selenocysteine lyase/cysteine desulfurase